MYRKLEDAEKTSKYTNVFDDHFKTILNLPFTSTEDELRNAFNLYVQVKIDDLTVDQKSKLFPTTYKDTLNLFAGIVDSDIHKLKEQMEKVIIYNENRTKITTQAVVDKIYSIKQQVPKELYSQMKMTTDIITGKYPETVYTDLQKLKDITENIYKITDTNYSNYDPSIIDSDNVRMYIDIIFARCVDCLHTERDKVRERLRTYTDYYIKWLYNNYTTIPIYFINQLTTSPFQFKTSINYNIYITDISKLEQLFYNIMYTQYISYGENTTKFIKSIPRGLRYVYDIIYNGYRLYYTHENKFITDITKYNKSKRDDAVKLIQPFTVYPEPYKLFFVANKLPRTEADQNLIYNNIIKSGRNVYNSNYYGYLKNDSVDVVPFFNTIKYSENQIINIISGSGKKTSLTLASLQVIPEITIEDEENSNFISCLASDKYLGTQFGIESEDYYVLTKKNRGLYQEIIKNYKNKVFNINKSISTTQMSLMATAKNWPNLKWSQLKIKKTTSDGGIQDDAYFAAYKERTFWQGNTFWEDHNKIVFLYIYYYFMHSDDAREEETTINEINVISERLNITDIEINKNKNTENKDTVSIKYKCRGKKYGPIEEIMTKTAEELREKSTDDLEKIVFNAYEAYVKKKTTTDTNASTTDTNASTTDTNASTTDDLTKPVQNADQRNVPSNWRPEIFFTFMVLGMILAAIYGTFGKQQLTEHSSSPTNSTFDESMNTTSPGLPSPSVNTSSAVVPSTFGELLPSVNVSFSDTSSAVMNMKASRLEVTLPTKDSNIDSITLVTPTGDINLNVPKEVILTFKTYPGIIYDVAECVWNRRSGVKEVPEILTVNSTFDESMNSTSAVVPLPSVNTTSAVIPLPPVNSTSPGLPSPSMNTTSAIVPVNSTLSSRDYGLVTVSQDEYIKINTSLRSVLKNVPENQKQNLIQKVNDMLVWNPAKTSSLLQKFMVSTNYRLVLDKSIENETELNPSDFPKAYSDAVKNFNTKLPSYKTLYEIKTELKIRPKTEEQITKLFDQQSNEMKKLFGDKEVRSKDLLIEISAPFTIISDKVQELEDGLFQRIMNIFSDGVGKRKREADVVQKTYSGLPGEDIDAPEFRQWRENLIADYYFEQMMDLEDKLKSPTKKKKISSVPAPMEDTTMEDTRAPNTLAIPKLTTMSCYTSSIKNLLQFVSDNKYLIAAGIGGLALVGGIGYTAGAYATASSATSCVSTADISTIVNIANTTKESYSHMMGELLKEYNKTGSDELLNALEIIRNKANNFNPLYNTVMNIVNTLKSKPDLSSCAAPVKYIMSCTIDPVVDMLAGAAAGAFTFDGSAHDGGICRFHNYHTGSNRNRNSRVAKQSIRHDGKRSTETKFRKDGTTTKRSNRKQKSPHQSLTVRRSQDGGKLKAVLRSIRKGIRKDTGGNQTTTKRSNKQRRMDRSKGKRRPADGGDLLMVNTPVIPYNTCKVWK